MKRLLLLLAAALSLEAQTLRIYAIDAEGGKATLYVAPSGESMLIDTGYAGNNNRDADRIVAAAKAAGVKRIDNLVITHFHGDHVGGVPQLVAKIPVGHIFDHGESFEKTNEKAQAVYEAYSAVRAKYPHTTLKPGDTVPIAGLTVQVVAGSGDAIEKPLPGAGQPNPLCSSYRAMAVDPGENAHSLALVITFGNFRVADLGDLYWNQEHELACPVNKLGTVDLYMTTHHGTKSSGSPQMVHALHPRVAIMNNGEDKGGSAEALTTLHSSPGLLDVWQLHHSNAGGDQNTADSFIANHAGEHVGNWIEVSAQKNGTFTVRNSRNQFQKTYRKQ